MPGSRDEDDDGEKEVKPGAKEGALLYNTFIVLMCKDSLILKLSMKLISMKL